MQDALIYVVDYMLQYELINGIIIYYTYVRPLNL